MSNKLTSKITTKVIISFIPTVVFACFILTMAIATSTNKDIQDAITSTELSAESLEKLSDTFEETLQDSIYQKNNYINLNGLSTRLLGINTLNERQKLANGQLAEFKDARNISTNEENIIELNEFLNNRDIDFVYVLVPHKLAFYDIEYSPGYGNNLQESFNDMLEYLDDTAINIIDMNTRFEEQGWTMDDVYFDTDHHWRPEAALEAARATMELLSQMGLVEYDENLLDENNWTVVTLEDWFLGSHGKRVGIYYASVDDIDVYYPNYETNYTFSGLLTNQTTWQYMDTILSEQLITNLNYFDNNPYNIYMFSNYRISKTINTSATNNKRILIMGDSYKLPYMYFLTTQFQEVYAMDLRYYSDGSFAQAVEEIQPDIIIMCTNSTDDQEIYNFGVSDYLAALDATDVNTEAIELGDFVIDVSDGNGDFAVVYAELEPEQTYTLTVDSTEYSGGNDLYVQMTLQNLSTNTAIYNRYFDANSDETQKWIFTVPDSANTYAIYLYAGTKGHTSGVSARVTSATLYEGIIE